MNTLLIVEDNQDVRNQLKWALARESYNVVLAQNAEEALEMVDAHSPAVVTLDLGLPPDAEGVEEGFRCLDAILQKAPDTQVVVVTGHHDRENALKAVRAGAMDFCRKPVNLDEIKVIINRAFYLGTLKSEQTRTIETTDSMCGIIGECEAMRNVYSTISKVAVSDAPVLITGESGTGKELAAHAVHTMSRRAKGPFVAINCGAIPEHLLESEFFGHEKGAFTGATGKVQGKVEYAEGGTLFLDEIGELPAALQVKLLRFLQEMSIQRVGGRKEIPVNTRITAATNIDILAAMREGTFREDLYYRIGVVTIELPPLRERGNDILLLAEYFLQRVNHEMGGRATGFTAAARKALLQYAWPGNVRQLENKIRRAVILSSTAKIDATDLEIDTTQEAPIETDARKTLKQARHAVEREMVESALKLFSGNIVQAAKSIGVSRPTFYDLLKKHNITT